MAVDENQVVQREKNLSSVPRSRACVTFIIRYYFLFFTRSGPFQEYEF